MDSIRKDPTWKNKRQLVQLLMNLFQENPNKEFGLKDLFKVLKLKTHPLKLLCTDVLDDLVADDYITFNKKHG